VKDEDSARMRDLLASNQTLLAWIRTGIAFAGLGFVVARFGLILATKEGQPVSESLVHFAGYIGTFMAAVGLLLVILGYVQYRAFLRQEETPPGAPQPLTWVSTVTVVTAGLSCAVVTAYLILAPTQ
jgi:uncharacterized membrane protein YidH (DUF202 family)